MAAELTGRFINASSQTCSSRLASHASLRSCTPSLFLAAGLFEEESFHFPLGPQRLSFKQAGGQAFVPSALCNEYQIFIRVLGFAFNILCTATIYQRRAPLPIYSQQALRFVRARFFLLMRVS